MEEFLFVNNYWQRELQQLHKDGSVIFVTTHWTLTRDEKGNPMAIVEAHNDITELKNAEQKITVLSKEINHSEVAILGVSFDITERVKLREQVNHLATIVEQSADAIVSVDLAGNILTWNDGAVVLYGYPAKEAISKNIKMLIPPELLDEQKSNMANVLEGKAIHQFETERIRKDGSRVAISLSFSLLKNSEGNLVGVSGIARNISERREAERKMMQSEENLKAVFENASEGFVLTNTEGIVKESNRRAQKCILFNADQKIKPGNSIFDFVEPGRKDFFKSIFSDVLQGKTIQYDRSLKDKDGNTTWMTFTYNPVRQDKAITGVCIAGLDITGKKMAEQQKEFDRNNLNVLINTTHDLMWSEGRDFKLITSNAAFDEMIKRMSGKTVEKGADILDWQLDKGMQQKYKHYYERAFSGEAFTELEYTVTSFEYWAENSFYPIYEGAVVIGTACFSRDISKQKKAEQQLHDSFKEKWALAKRMSAILNTLPANIALLNDKGIIVDVNNSWKNFVERNNFQGSQYGIGQNYLQIAEKASCKGESEGKIIAEGIQAVIDNQEPEFIFEYACGAPGNQRWFRMVATPLRDKEYAGAVVMHLDISKLKELERETLQTKMNEQKKITRAILQAQEKERNALGRELHDNICQVLAAIKMKMTFCTDNHSLSMPVIADCVDYLDDAINETRSLSHRMLMPRFTESSLMDALQNLTAIYSQGRRTVTLKSSAQEENNIPAPVKETLYRIAQEQLHNVEKYAKATDVNVYINSQANMITLCVEDNGLGFDPKKKRNGVGITNIMNRAESFNGSVKIISAPGEGCLLMVEIPFAR